MREISLNIPFFIYFERYYGQHNPTRNKARQPPAKSLPRNPSQAKDKSALDIVVRKLEEIAKKPAIPLPKSPSQLKVIKLQKTPSNSSYDT